MPRHGSRSERPARSDPAATDRALYGRILDELIGAALVVDDQLRVRVATAAAEAVLGIAVPIGISAPSLLCGDKPVAPFADALADGTPFQAIIPRPQSSAGDGEQVRVRSVPIATPGGDAAWLVYLAPVGSSHGEPVHFQGMWTCDARMKELFRIITKVAIEDATVLVRGETGAGKELVAHAIHGLSSRKDGPFRALNCAALPANLLESELFGHVRGAFTGAVKDTPGHVQLADGGTLFLDEVAELPLELQAKLLRVLETRTVLPVGARDPVPVDVRVVSATHRALRTEVEAGRFRSDLMYRLRVIPVYLPPLRDRPADVHLLTDKLIEELNARGRRRVERVSAAAAAALERYGWPGNVRELRNVLAYGFAIGDGPVLDLHDLPPEVGAVGGAPGGEIAVTPEPPADLDLEPDVRRIRDALVRTGGNRDRAAKLLGVSRVTLWRRMRALGLEA